MKGMTMNRSTKAASTLTLLSALLSGCCQAGSPCENTPIGPSTGEIVGISLGVAAAGALAVGTAVAVNHDRHILKGCVAIGQDGLQLTTRDSDKKAYTLVGISADIKPGEKVKLHGTKQKKRKGSQGNQQFFVDRVTKDLGPCEAAAASPTTPSSAQSH
jgi:hypothetical protein